MVSVSKVRWETIFKMMGGVQPTGIDYLFFVGGGGYDPNIWKAVMWKCKLFFLFPWSFSQQNQTWYVGFMGKQIFILCEADHSAY